MSPAIGFAERLRAIRAEKGLNQSELARAAKLSSQMVSALENGTREPGWATVVALARALGVSVATFDIEPPAGTAEHAEAEAKIESKETGAVPMAMGKRK